MDSWGAVLRRAHNLTDVRTGTSRRPHATDPATGTLSFWTDNGAFYRYYHYTASQLAAGEGPGGEIPGRMMIDVQKKLDEQKVPVRYYQLDAYWYHDSSASINKAVANQLKLGIDTPTTLKNWNWLNARLVEAIADFDELSNTTAVSRPDVLATVG